MGQRGTNHRIRSVIVVNEWVEYQEEIMAMLKDMLTVQGNSEWLEKDIAYNLILDLMSKPYLNKFDDGFAYCKNGYIYMGDANVSIYPHMCDQLDKLVNDDLRQIFCTVPFNRCFLVNSNIYKAVGGSRPIMVNGEIDQTNFFDRLSKFKCDILGDDFWEGLNIREDRWMNGN